jgi:signal transduction histidine kinase
MKRSWFPITLVILLLGLLALLATLQYRWLGQISDGERARLQNRLQTDTRRFAEDFNREIQNAYFNFQFSSEVWQDKNWNEFNQRVDFWRGKTAYPNLIKNFYFVELGGENLLRYDNQSKTFQAADWTTANLINLKPKIFAETNFQPIAEDVPALLMPVHTAEDKITRVINIRTAKLEQEDFSRVLMPKRYGVLVIELDADVVVNQLLPDVAKKYFSDSSGGADYKFAVAGAENRIVFQTEDLTAIDSSAKFFNLAPDNFISFNSRDLLSTIQGEKKSVVFSRIERATRQSAANDKPNRVEEQVLKGDEKPRIRIFDGENLRHNDGVWTLNVQHTAGSLEQFIANTRRKNLGVSFGILSLLAVSVVLIFLSAQRATRFAQKQVDFVSAVSHEFRTPLAVIRSAGENLIDGVVRDENQISQYGNLIKREGVKLSAMVEQILEFAGARSGKRKYDLRETEIEKIIENALAECEPLIKEKGFTIEKEIAENLSPITADEKALSQTIQNLIVNAIKYGNGNAWLKISATNGDGKIKIVVEDKGIGIAPNDLKHIFEPFYRSKTVVDEQIHGNGLGLSLVRQTVAAHGGRIAVKSEIGKGSRFTIEIPQKKN